MPCVLEGKVVSKEDFIFFGEGDLEPIWSTLLFFENIIIYE